jgi:hypothetical protein
MLKEEQAIQINLINWFKEEYPQLSDDIHHFANERKCSYQEGRKLKKMGVTKGVSDIFLGIPTELFYGLWIELKTEKGKLTDEQIKFINKKNERGYFAIAVWGLEAAKEVIRTYLRDEDE